MKSRIMKLSLLAAPLMMSAVLVGCNSTQNEQHEQWVQEADDRWTTIKTAQALVMAQQKFDTGDLDLAEQEAKNALAADPDNGQLHMLLGQIELERGRLERSYQQFTVAIEHEPELAHAHYLRGIVLQRINKLELSYESYYKAFELEHDNAAYLLAAGEMLVSLDRAEEALALLEKQLDVFDANAALRLQIAHIHAMKQRYSQAASFFNEAAMLDPDNTKPLEELASVQLADGQILEASRTLSVLLKESGLEDRSDLRRMLADAYMKLQRYDDAQKQYLKVARSVESRSGDWVNLGQLALRKGKDFDALHASRKAIELDPVAPDGYMLAGLVWQKRGKLDEALQMFDRAADLSPDDAAPLMMRGVSLQQAGRHAAAQQAYRDALERDPEDSRARKLLASLSSDQP